jgi:hemolysin III
MTQADSRTAGQARPTRSEFVVDMAIHAGGLVGGLTGAIVLLTLAAQGGGPAALAASGVYSVGLLAMLASSAAYNWGRSGPWHEGLRRLDQSAIFAMIAGSYTPFTTLHLTGAWAGWLTGLIWAVAAVGILLRLFAPRSFDRL